MTGAGLKTEDAGGAFEKAGGVVFQRLHGISAHVFVKAGMPDDLHAIARLENRLHAPGASAAYQPQMPAMDTRHHLKDGAGFAMLAGSEDDSFVLPLHRAMVAPSVGKV